MCAPRLISGPRTFSSVRVLCGGGPPHTFYSDLAVRGQGICAPGRATERPRLMARQGALSSRPVQDPAQTPWRQTVARGDIVDGFALEQLFCFADLLRIEGGRTAKSRAAGFSRFESSLCPIADQGALEFSQGGDHVKHEHAGRCAGIDRFVQGGEVDAPGAQIIHHDQQLAQRAAKPVESPHDKGVAGLAFIEDALKSGALKASTGDALVGDDGIAAIGLERQYLQV
ncbi:hypothetical protein BSE24067_03643 [Burkholderia seminalis]|nr:hypothetical protein BSE24067_03643 [Burkholderia seminalis]